VDGDVILFWVVAVLAVTSALIVVLHRNVVYCALALVMALFQVALMFVALDAHLIALLQIIIYAGAIVVLFLFVIMLLSLEPDVRHPGRYGMRGASIMFTVVLGVELGVAALISEPGSLVPPPVDFGSTRVVALRLFSVHLLPFELTGVLLLVAVVGAVVMARRRA
jgi:NADH-quinone oxidoreductase subunit J